MTTIHSLYGKGVLKAVANVNERIAPILIDMDPAHQIELIVPPFPGDKGHQCRCYVI